jgi:glycine/D-amino acid oxidase-like deaminating enzyme/nitrite reductase/ring-hydroxylating ferredoxin subunit
MTRRDGNLVSLWQATSSTYSNAAKPAADTYDVVIVGGGITGITTADILLREGLSCLVMEAQQLCFGTTGGTTAHINTLLDTPYSTLIKNFGLDNARKVFEACRHGIDQIRSNVLELDVDCGWKECKAFLFAENEQQQKELEEITEACRRVGLDPHTVQQIPVPIPFVSAISVDRQAKFHPTRYVHALAGRFEKMGGTILEDCRVTELIENDDYIEVVGSKAKVKAKWVVLATHIPPTINVLHLRCAPYRSYAMAAQFGEAEHFDDLVYDMRDPYHYFRTQEIDGEVYLIAGGKDHKTGQPQNNAHQHMRLLESHVRKHFNIDEVKAAWSSQYYESADGLPYIGHLPGHSERILTATGFGGNGMIYSTIASSVLRNIVIDRHDELIDLFSPGRIKPIAGFRNFASHNLDVTRKIIGKIFNAEEIEGYADLAPGESRVIKSDLGKVAVHKDERGDLHAVSAVCTHMGCDVAWNDAESSWDCPCHGARYAVDGTVLNGPAVQDLEFLNVEIVSTSKG